jgi:acetyl-CoA carboxylase carboxyl transferase subunit beta
MIYSEIPMGMFNDRKNPKLKIQKKPVSRAPEGQWKKCTKCGEIIQHSKLMDAYQVCPYCDHHYRLTAEERLAMLVDSDTFYPILENLGSTDPLNFYDKKSYKERLEKEFEKTGEVDGTMAGTAKINGKEVALAIMNFRFMGGSMGVATGEKIAAAMDLAYEKNIPCIVVSSSGGARMQEGILSLMQMAKTSASRQRLRNAGIPYISILTDPTTGGSAASFSMLGDLNIAEPNALIGFAGPRVIEQSIRQKLPKGFQRSEFLLEHGFIDSIVHRHRLKEELSFYLEMFDNK